MLRTVGTALILAALQGNGDPHREWRTKQELPVARPGLVVVTLPGETLDAAKSGLEDLRVLDPAGREVPWAPEQAPRARPGPRLAVSFETILTDGRTELRIVTGLDEPLARVDLEMSSWDFVKAARIEESANGRDWTLVRDGEPLFSAPGGARKTSMDLPPSRRALLRVTLDDRRSRPVPVTAVRVVPVSPPPPPTEPLEVDVLERREAPGLTRLRLRFPGRHIRLSEVRIDTPEPVFQRLVELSGEVDGRPQGLSGDTIYRTPTEERRSLDARVLLPTREAVLTIHHGDSPPLAIDRVRVRSRPVRIYFMATGAGVHRLLAGNSGAAAARYDVGVLGEPGTGDPATPGALRVNPDWRPSEPIPGVIPAGARIEVDAWSFHKELRLGPGRVHEVELDPEILGASDPSGSDWRLVRGGQQIPYLRDDPPRLRPLRPVVTRTEERGRTSRWTLVFSRPRLPVRRLSCAVSGPLFRREARLFEDVRDEFGVGRRTLVGQATWSRTPERPPERLELELDRGLRTDRLVLEVENGDNPPLDLGDVEATYAAPRLVFKAEPGPGVSLVYGNREAASPRYDLTLVAAELMSADRSAAALGAEAPESPASRPEDAMSGSGGLFFWGVLGLLTLVLLAVIVRLFPSPGWRDEADPKA